MTIKLEVTTTERALLVAALKAYGYADGMFENFASRIAAVPVYDPTEDGPEVAILSVAPEEIA